MLLRVELGAGTHMGPSGRLARLRYAAEVSAFIMDAMGLGGQDGQAGGCGCGITAGQGR